MNTVQGFSPVPGEACRNRRTLRLAAGAVLGLGLALGVMLVVSARGGLQRTTVEGETAQVASPYSWLIETVDDAGKTGLFTSLALEPAPPYIPHVSYCNVDSGSLMYARRGSGGWMTETITSGGEWVYSALALEPAAPYTPHIVYCDTAAYALAHAWLSGSTWYTEVVESGPEYKVEYISLVLEPVSPYTLHVVYQDESPDVYDLKHAWRVPSGWLTETVDSEWNVGEYPSIALEPASPYTPHISYYKGAFYVDDLKHAWWTPSGWLSETLDTTGDVGKYSSLALELTPPYTPHIAYFDNTNADLRHAWRTPSGWLTETVDSEGMVGLYASLALESTSPYTPHIAYFAYFDETNGDVRHAWLTPSGWLTETVAGEGNVGWHISLALEPVPPYIPHIAYYDVSNQDLKHAWLVRKVFSPLVLRDYSP
jgi:hypothetical protein